MTRRSPLLALFVFLVVATQGCVSEINRVGVSGEAGSAKAAKTEATPRVVPSRATPDQPAYTLTGRVRRAELFPQHTLSPAEDSPSFVVQNEPISVPAGSGARSPRLVRSADGPVRLAWIEPSGKGFQLRITTYLDSSRSWTPANTLLAMSTPPTGFAVAPGAAGRLAILLAEERLLRLIVSDDGLANWHTERIPTDAAPPSAPALQFLADGRLLAVWLEEHAPGDCTLQGRILGAPEAPPLTLAAASPGSRPALAAFPDGGALIAYRAVINGRTHDLRTLRFQDGAWTPSAALSPDDWEPASPPAEGPALAVRGAHLAAVWFTAADGPRINLSVSSNAGRQWLMPERIDDVAPVGRADLVMLDDGANLASWVERDGTGDNLYLRRLSPRHTLGVPVRIAEKITGHPSLVRIKDGDSTPAQLLVAYEASAQLHTRLLTLPDAGQLAEADLCGCDPRPEEQRGYAIKGRILSIDSSVGTVTLAHEEIPGLMKAASTVLKAAPDVLAVLRPGSRVFARIERLGPDWWLFTPRVLVAP